MRNVLRLMRKSRKYPIKRDEYDQSTRQRTFNCFKISKGPAEVATIVRIRPRTAHRYYADWKNIPKNFEVNYLTFWDKLKNDPDLSGSVVGMLAEYLGTSREEVILRLQKPWGLKSLLIGQWPNYRQEKIYRIQAARLMGTLRFIVLIENRGMKP